MTEAILGFRRCTRGLAFWLWLLVLAASPGAQAQVDFAALGVVEVELTGDRDYDNPFWDATVVVEAVAPSGRMQRVEAFWDGGRTWRARWRGDEGGLWTWQATASDKTNAGLNARGQVNHGDARPPRMLSASDDGTHLVDDAGTPFFWLADTAWNGALRSQASDWESYLALRAEQKFTAIQFVTTQWRGGDQVIPRHAFRGTDHITIDPHAFAVLDDKVASVVKHGLRPAPVMLWALTPTDPGQSLSDADAIRLARYQVARWGALAPAWLLGGDGRFLGDATPRWKRLGREVFGDHPEQLVTLHPSGLSWIGDAFAGEHWLDFIGYQSGHGDSDDDLKWLVLGPPAQSAKLGKPVINLEPNYEGHPAYQSNTPHSAHAVRRASYWSLLVHAPAGVTYGSNEIWVWNEHTADAENHDNLPQIRPWRDGLKTEGLEGMTHLRAFFETGPWFKLRPAPQLLEQQSGVIHPHDFVPVAQTPDGEWTVAYMPTGGDIALKMDPAGKSPRWFDPRRGEYRDAQIARREAVVTFTAPDNSDWVLTIE